MSAWFDSQKSPAIKIHDEWERRTALCPGDDGGTLAAASHTGGFRSILTFSGSLAGKHISARSNHPGIIHFPRRNLSAQLGSMCISIRVCLLPKSPLTRTLGYDSSPFPSSRRYARHTSKSCF